jgi:hypothetical protein
MSSGATINLTDIFTSPVGALSALSTQAHAALATTFGSDLTWSGTATAMSFFDKARAMAPAGLEFTWAHAAIASEAEGMRSATLAWSIIETSRPAGEFVD